MRNVIGQSFFCGSGCDARSSRAGDLPRAGDFSVAGVPPMARHVPVDHRGSVSGKPVGAKEVNRLWVANTRAANEISELCCEELSSSDDAARATAGREEEMSAGCAHAALQRACAG
ncbi:hypothetical protein [Burkholderia sp. RF4-BP95]|uniref:hypothetical protein n=1 Tax=Burkholderia sp. RF4-BP95 TaxID=1637845 RepID=UPI0012E3A793|nr:hypothetical protein [Burkholderia sp. RF4-BP95]